MGDPFGQVQVCLRLGDIERQLECFSEAAKWYERAQRLIGKNKSTLSKPLKRAVLDAASGKALCLRGKGQLRKAERWLHDLLFLYKEEKDHEGAAYLYWALGTTERFLGNLRLAEKNLKASLREYSRLKNRSGQAYALCGLGGTYRMQGLARNQGLNIERLINFFLRRGMSLE